MRNVIAHAVNRKDYGGRKPPQLLEMIVDDLLVLLKFIHQSQQTNELSANFIFTDQIDYLDSVWHHFILHTQIYSNFCEQEFGEYLHHVPENGENGTVGSGIAISNVLEQQMDLMERKLGPDFVNRVYFLYPTLLKDS